jgi:hypothetical protein
MVGAHGMRPCPTTQNHYQTDGNSDLCTPPRARQWRAAGGFFISLLILHPYKITTTLMVIPSQDIYMKGYELLFAKEDKIKNKKTNPISTSPAKPRG